MTSLLLSIGSMSFNIETGATRSFSCMYRWVAMYCHQQRRVLVALQKVLQILRTKKENKWLRLVTAHPAVCLTQNGKRHVE